jgi:hypothetical protein
MQLKKRNAIKTKYQYIISANINLLKVKLNEEYVITLLINKTEEQTI